MDNGGITSDTAEHAEVSVREVLLQLAQTTTDASSKQALLELASGLNVESGVGPAVAANVKPNGNGVLDSGPAAFAAKAARAVATGDIGQEIALDDEMERWLALVIKRDFGAAEDARERPSTDEAYPLPSRESFDSHSGGQSGGSSPTGARTAVDSHGVSASEGDDTAILMRALNDDAGARRARAPFGPGALIPRRHSFGPGELSIGPAAIVPTNGGSAHAIDVRLHESGGQLHTLVMVASVSRPGLVGDITASLMRQGLSIVGASVKSTSAYDSTQEAAAAATNASASASTNISPKIVARGLTTLFKNIFRVVDSATSEPVQDFVRLREIEVGSPA